MLQDGLHGLSTTLFHWKTANAIMMLNIEMLRLAYFWLHMLDNGTTSSVSYSFEKMKIASNNYGTALSNEESHGFHPSLKFVFEKVKFSKLCSRVDVHQ